MIRSNFTLCPIAVVFNNESSLSALRFNYRVIVVKHAGNDFTIQIQCNLLTRKANFLSDLSIVQHFYCLTVLCCCNSVSQRLIIGTANLSYRIGCTQLLNSAVILNVTLCNICRNIRGECTALQLDVVGCRVVCRICRIGCIKINALCCIHIKFLIANTALCRASASKRTAVYSYLSCSCNDTNTVMDSKITTVYSNNIFPRRINATSDIASRFNIARKRTTVDGNYIGITFSFGAITCDYSVIRCTKYAIFNSNSSTSSLTSDDCTFHSFNIRILDCSDRIITYTNRNTNITAISNDFALLGVITNSQSTIVLNILTRSFKRLTIYIKSNT